MNTYKILTFDGYNSNEILVQGYDVIQAIQGNGIMAQHIIKIELVGSASQQNMTIPV